VVQALWDAYPAAEWHFRLYATGPLGRVHTDLSVAACRALIEKEEDPELQEWLATSLVEHFSSEGNELAVQMMRDKPYLNELRFALVPACLLLGQHFPGLEEWRRDLAGIERRASALESMPEPPTAPERGPSHLPPPPVLRPVRVEKTVGRNDPCPCGSGKKFKKCCMNKPGPS
jgi:hypothetical protein